MAFLEQVGTVVNCNLNKVRNVRLGLDALTLRLDDGAAATTIARKRSVFYNVLQYAVDLEELASNPIDKVKAWKPPKVREVVDQRVVVNPVQARKHRGLFRFPGLTWGNAANIIPRIFRYHRPRAAHGGVRLRTRETINGAWSEGNPWSDAVLRGERRAWDSNPRGPSPALAVFKTAAIVH